MIKKMGLKQKKGYSTPIALSAFYTIPLAGVFTNTQQVYYIPVHQCFLFAQGGY